MLLVAGLGALAGCGGGAASPAGASSPSPSPSGPAAKADVFDDTMLHEIEVVMDPADWQTLRDHFESDDYYSAGVTIDGESVPQSGVRSRGGGTRNGTKPSLQVKFNEYVKAQRFQGRKTIVVKNLVDDASFLREFLSMATYRAMEVPAPRESFARLLVNGEYFGLFNVIEKIDESFLDDRFHESAGYLYDYEYPGPWDFSSRGNAPADYVPLPFEPQTHEDDPAPEALLAMIRTMNSSSDEEWTSSMSAYVDLQQLATFLAVENALTAGDATVGVFGVNNFSLYQSPGGSRFVFIPWDRGATFQAVEWPVLYRMDQTVLTRRFLADPERMALYGSALRKTVTDCLNRDVLGKRLEAAYVLVRQAALTDSKKPYTNQEFEQGVIAVRDVVARRRDNVLRQVPALEATGAARRGP